MLESNYFLLLVERKYKNIAELWFKKKKKKPQNKPTEQPKPN